MPDISVIILTYNEEIHIGRCIENIRPVAREIFVVDSFSHRQGCMMSTNIMCLLTR
jgi:glycosyltransferase involved in cell wall biosynthesis